MRLPKPLILIDRKHAEPRGERFHSCWQGRVTHTRHHLSVCVRARARANHRNGRRRKREKKKSRHSRVSLSRAHGVLVHRECSPAARTYVVGEPNLHRALASVRVAGRGEATNDARGDARSMKPPCTPGRRGARAREADWLEPAELGCDSGPSRARALTLSLCLSLPSHFLAPSRSPLLASV